MSKIEKTAVNILGILALGVGFGFAGYRMMGAKSHTENQVETVQATVESLPDMPVLAQGPSFFNNDTVIGAQTHMVYEYVYENGAATETAEEQAPYFLQNINQKKLADLFSDWQITEFSKERVVMRKVLDDTKAQRYKVGVSNGYVSVFYETPMGNSVLKETTKTPIGAFHAEEQSRLRTGIEVFGDAELMRVLQDYSS